MARKQGTATQAPPARLDGKTGAGVYIWPSVDVANRAHNEEWRQSVIKRTGGAPTIRYFEQFLLVDNESGEVTEFPGCRTDWPPPACNTMLWAVFTLIAAAAQTARNAMQRELTATLGTVGATHVRFLFGFPFALLFLAGVMLVTGAPAASAGEFGPGCSPARWRRSPRPR